MPSAATRNHAVDDQTAAAALLAERDNTARASEVIDKDPEEALLLSVLAGDRNAPLESTRRGLARSEALFEVSFDARNPVASQASLITVHSG